VYSQNEWLGGQLDVVGCGKILAMISLLRHFLGCVLTAVVSQEDLILENLALRQQLLILHTRKTRHRFTARQKLFWVLLRRLWSGWKTPLLHPILESR
jgi:hypothetical protein